jgi:hypothetical protein
MLLSQYKTLHFVLLSYVCYCPQYKTLRFMLLSYVCYCPQYKTLRFMLLSYVCYCPQYKTQAYARFQDSATTYLKPSPFWVEDGISWRTDWPLQKGPIRSPETLVTSYQPVPRNIQDLRRLSMKRTEIFTQGATHFRPILTRLELSWQILIKLHRTKCHEDLPSRS